MRILHTNRHMRVVYMGAGLIFSFVLLLAMHGTEAQHTTHHTDGSVRMTMEALHAAGGVPHAVIVTGQGYTDADGLSHGTHDTHGHGSHHPTR